jgi:hypothetical protein
MPGSDPIPIYTKQLAAWLQKRTTNLKQNSPPNALTATKVVYERGFNDAIDFLVKYIEVSYDKEYDD